VAPADPGARGGGVMTAVRPLSSPCPGDVLRTLDVCHDSTLTYQTLVREGLPAEITPEKVPPMDLARSPADEAFPRRGPRALAARAPSPGRRSPPWKPRRASPAHRAWEAELATDPLVGGVPGPAEYGGRGADIVRWLVFEEEYYAAGRPRPGSAQKRHQPARPERSSTTALRSKRGARAALHGDR